MDPVSSDTLVILLKKDAQRRLIGESIPRIRHCLAQLSEEEIWHRPNNNLVSIGNLVLHLCGNVRQWLISGLGGAPDARDRDSEFNETGPLPTRNLLSQLDLLESEITQTLDKVKREDLCRAYKVQGFEESGTSILVHVIEHFSYHVGQISWHTKLIKNLDLGYYKDFDL